MTDVADVLLVGAGDLGTEIGLRLEAVGRPVAAMRRRAELVPAPMLGISGDVGSGLPDASALPQFSGPGGGPRLLVVCLTAGGRDEQAYREVFLDGVGRLLADLAERGWAPERALFVSSTGVCAAHGRVDESTPPDPATSTSAVLAQAEQQFLAQLPAATSGIVVRPSGLYGPGREWFINQVRNGTINNAGRMTHRIHRDDAAAAVVHLLTMPERPQPLYLLTDDTPVIADEVAAFIADELGVARPESPLGGVEGAQESSREQNPESRPDPASSFASDEINEEPRLLLNARLKATGFQFEYPGYREGYAAILRHGGVRHP